MTGEPSGEGSFSPVITQSKPPSTNVERHNGAK